MFRIITFSAIFLLYGCYKAQDKVYDSVYIENIPSNWESAEYQNDYKINDFWPSDRDSTLIYLLEDFNVNNQDMLLLDVQQKISEIYYGISVKELYPEVSLSSSATKSKQNLSAFGLSDDFLSSSSNDESEGDGSDSQGGGFTSFTNSARLNASWELDLWNRIKYSRESSYFDMESELYEIKYAKSSLRAQFIKLYFTAISLAQEINIYEENLFSLLKLKEISEKRALEGISGYDEVYLASSNYYLYESNIKSLKHDYEKIVREIKLMMGNYLGANKEISFSKYPIDIIDIQSDIETDLLNRRPDIVAYKNKVISSRFKLKSDRKLFFPRISFNTSKGYSSSDLERLIEEEFAVWNLGLNVLAPIFNAGSIKRNIKITEHKLEVSELQYIKAVVSAIYQVDGIILHGNSLKDSYQKIIKAEKDAEKALKYALSSYELGLVDLIYVLNIQERLNSISINKNKILLGRYINRVDLILSLGGKFEY